MCGVCAISANEAKRTLRRRRASARTGPPWLRPFRLGTSRKKASFPNKAPERAGESTVSFPRAVPAPYRHRPASPPLPSDGCHILTRSKPLRENVREPAPSPLRN